MIKISTRFLKLLTLLKVLMALVVIFVMMLITKWGMKKILNDDLNLKQKSFLPIFVQPESIYVPTNISEYKEREFVACFVASAPGNRIQRDAIRQSWGKLLKPIFLMGRDDRHIIEATKEAEEFNDIIIEDFVDSYRNLTIKVAFAFKNFLKHFKDTKYFFKTDDDCFVNVLILQDLVKVAPENDIIGFIFPANPIIRDTNSQFYVSQAHLEGDFFPTYIAGFGYVLPGKKRCNFKIA
jgi:Galactosyltransferase